MNTGTDQISISQQLHFTMKIYIVSMRRRNWSRSHHDADKF